MLLGPALTGVLWTWVTEDQIGMTKLLQGMRKFNAGPCWYLVLIIPPALVLATLLCLKLVAPEFAPNQFYLGILFGIPAGFLEEIGWTGFAFPRLQSQFGFFRSSILLGVIWGVWHLPVVNHLGAAAPHGSFWFQFFLAFTFAMVAMRVLIAWIYVNTKSVWLAQLMHMSSTGALVVFSPHVTPEQEVLWYALYGFILWIAATLLGIVSRFSPRA